MDLLDYADGLLCCCLHGLKKLLVELYAVRVFMLPTTIVGVWESWDVEVCIA